MTEDSIVLSRWAFALWWFALLVMHVVVASYNALCALFYKELDGTYLNTVLEFMSLGMPTPYHSKIVAAYSIMAALHGLCLTLMICGSVWHWSLRFSIEIRVFTQWQERTTRGLLSNPKSSKAAKVWKLLLKLFGRDGLFGVRSPYFHSVLIVQEIIEAVLQTIHAHRMSTVLPRRSENWFFVILLVLNCCAPLAIHEYCKHNEPSNRFVNLMCDCFLDLVVTVGIPVIIVLTYVGQYSTWYTGFPTELWYNDVWVAHVQNEFQLVLVVSWADLVSRIIFSWGVLSASTHMKSLLTRSGSTSQVASVRTQGNNSTKEATSRTPTISLVHDMTVREVKRQGWVRVAKPRAESAFKSAYYMFVLLGITVLGLHIHAESRPQLPQCLLQVRPWGIHRPSCYLAELNCDRLDIRGSKSEMVHAWSAFDRGSVVQLLVRHCSHFEMPPMIEDFKRLSGSKMYNSTIAEWGSDSAFTSASHPQIIIVYLVRVNLTGGVIPDGLLAQDFPPTLIDLEFVVTNLQELPDDIDDIWPIGTSVYIEYSNLTLVPASLIRLQPYYISVCGNPIREIPAEVFEIPNLIYLHVGSTLIDDLPRNVTALSPAMSRIQVSNTNISFFWPWIDEMLRDVETYIIAGGTRYCSSLELFLDSGDVEGFSIGALTSSNLSRLMLPETYSSLTIPHVLCEGFYSGPLYPLAAEDQYSAIAPVS